MADRYQRQIGEGSAPKAYLHSHTTAESAGAGVAAALGGLGNAMGQAAEQLEVLNVRQEQVDFTAAIDDYNGCMNFYLSDPQKGQMGKRPLKEARGLVSDTERFADALREDVASRLNERTAARFRSFEAEMRQPYLTRSAAYEEEQGREYERLATETALQGFLQSVTADPHNERMLETATYAGALALGQQMQEQPSEAIMETYRSWVSRLDAARIRQVLTTDPQLAQQMVTSSQYLQPEARTALSEKVNEELERIEVERGVEDLFGRFGAGKAEEAEKYAQRNYRADKRESILAEYGIRSDDRLAAEAEQQAAQSQAQGEYWRENFYRKYGANNLHYPLDALRNAYGQGAIGEVQYERGLKSNTLRAERVRLENALQEKDPARWQGLSPNQREREVMTTKGISEEEHKARYQDLLTRSFDTENPLQPDEVELVYEEMRITRDERDELLRLEGSLTKEQWEDGNKQLRMVEQGLSGVYAPEGSEKYVGRAKERFLSAIVRLDPQSETYREDVQRAGRNALGEAERESYEDLRRAISGNPARRSFMENMRSGLGRPGTGVSSSAEDEAPLHLYASNRDTGIVTDARIDSGGMGQNVLPVELTSTDVLALQHILGDIVTGKKVSDVTDTKKAPTQEGSAEEISEKAFALDDVRAWIEKDLPHLPAKAAGFLAETLVRAHFPEVLGRKLPKGFPKTLPEKQKGFQDIVEDVIEMEGGYVNNAADRGGPTNMGITQDTLNSAYKLGLVDHTDVQHGLKKEEARKIYKEMFWDLVHADELPPGVDFMVFDAGVNIKPVDSIMKLQIALNDLRMQDEKERREALKKIEAVFNGVDGKEQLEQNTKGFVSFLQQKGQETLGEEGRLELLKVDGLFGEKTKKAAWEANPEKLVEALYVVRLRAHERNLQDFNKKLKEAREKGQEYVNAFWAEIKRKNKGDPRVFDEGLRARFEVAREHALGILDKLDED